MTTINNYLQVYLEYSSIIISTHVALESNSNHVFINRQPKHEETVHSRDRLFYRARFAHALPPKVNSQRREGYRITTGLVINSHAQTIILLKLMQPEQQLVLVSIIIHKTEFHGNYQMAAIQNML
jgi:hypothetical protein